MIFDERFCGRCDCVYHLTARSERILKAVSWCCLAATPSDPLRDPAPRCCRRFSPPTASQSSHDGDGEGKVRLGLLQYAR